MAAIWAVRHRLYNITSVESYQHDRTKELRPKPRTRLKPYVSPPEFTPHKLSHLELAGLLARRQSARSDCRPILLPAS